MVTAGTYKKEPHFAGDTRLRALHDGLLRYASLYKWKLEAWAVFPNHYHFIAHAPGSEKESAESLRSFLTHWHAKSAAWINKRDGTPSRKVWHNFWETHLTYETSYFARLNYVHQNAVHHRLVTVANAYPWCSAAWFERSAPAAHVKTIYSFKSGQLNILDEF